MGLLWIWIERLRGWYGIPFLFCFVGGLQSGVYFGFLFCLIVSDFASFEFWGWCLDLFWAVFSRGLV